MAADAQSSNWIDFQSINPDDLQAEDQLRQRDVSTRFDAAFISSRFSLDLSVSQLPGMLENCTNSSEGFSSSLPTRRDPVKMLDCAFYPTCPENRTRLFCCRGYSQMPIHFFLKAVIEFVYHSVLDSDISFKELHIEVHKKLHRAIDGMIFFLEITGLGRLFERVALTLADGTAADVIIEHGLNALTNSFSNVTGEFILFESLLRDAFSFKETDDSVQYSARQPVTPYFLCLIQEHSAAKPEFRITLEAIPGTDSFFMMRTGLQNNRAYLPLLFCLGMIVGCPLACRMSSTYWVFTKEVLYMLAKTFGILDMNMSGMLYNLLSEDICRCGKRQRIYCRPLWRVLISIERTTNEPECLSHIPRTAATMVELTRFSDIMMRTMRLVEYDKTEIEREKHRILNMCEYRTKEQLRDECIVAVLMYERKQLIELLPQFIPKLKWIHKRKRLVSWNEEVTPED